MDLFLWFFVHPLKSTKSTWYTHSFRLTCSYLALNILYQTRLIRQKKSSAGERIILKEVWFWSEWWRGNQKFNILMWPLSSMSAFQRSVWLLVLKSAFQTNMMTWILSLELRKKAFELVYNCIPRVAIMW